MQKIRVNVLTRENFKGQLPSYETVGASGFDVRAQLSQSLVIEPGKRVLIPTGLSFEIPLGYEIQVRPRSGWALKSGIAVLNSPGTIDCDYRGEVKVIVANLGEEAFTVHDQDRIAQMVLCPVFQAEFVTSESLQDTHRGEGGFGSTGRA